MPLLQALRQSKFIARCVLVWFALAMAAAVAAPVVNPQGTQLVCSAAGTVKLVNAGADESAPMQSHLLDCVLCLAFSGPPAQTVSGPEAPTNLLSFALQPAPSPWVARRTAAPLLARGPPLA
jgi:hypothetical protein